MCHTTLLSPPSYLHVVAHCPPLSACAAQAIRRMVCQLCAVCVFTTPNTCEIRPTSSDRILGSKPACKFTPQGSHSEGCETNTQTSAFARSGAKPIPPTADVPLDATPVANIDVDQLRREPWLEASDRTPANIVRRRIELSHSDPVRSNSF